MACLDFGAGNLCCCKDPPHLLPVALKLRCRRWVAEIEILGPQPHPLDERTHLLRNAKRLYEAIVRAPLARRSHQSGPLRLLHPAARSEPGGIAIRPGRLSHLCGEIGCDGVGGKFKRIGCHVGVAARRFGIAVAQ